MTTASDSVFDGTNPHAMKVDKPILAEPVRSRYNSPNEIWLMEIPGGGGIEPFWYSKSEPDFTRPGIPYAKITHRNIREVIKQIIPLLPVDTPDPEDDFTPLKEEMEKFAGAWFVAPEAEMPLWIGLATTLEEWFGEPTEHWEDWKRQVLAIFSEVVA